MADVSSESKQTGILDNLNPDTAREAFAQARESVDDALEAASKIIRERPIACVVGGLAIGYAIGKIVSR